MRFSAVIGFQPRFQDAPYSTPPERVEDVARTALDAMLTRPFRVGPLPPTEAYEALLERVRRQVRRGEPVFITQGYAPLKNPNNVPQSRADWAEFFSLLHLAAWHNKVQAVYPPGLRIQIAFDDATLAMANHAGREAMRSYITSIQQLIPVLGLEHLIVGTMRHSAFAWLFHFGLYPLARLRVWCWERDPAHRPQIERMEQFARRNVRVAASLSPAAQERYIQAASHRYRVYWEAPAQRAHAEQEPHHLDVSGRRPAPHSPGCGSAPDQRGQGAGHPALAGRRRVVR